RVGGGAGWGGAGIATFGRSTPFKRAGYNANRHGPRHPGVHGAGTSPRRRDHQWTPDGYLRPRRRLVRDPDRRARPRRNIIRRDSAGLVPTSNADASVAKSDGPSRPGSNLPAGVAIQPSGPLPECHLPGSGCPRLDARGPGVGSQGSNRSADQPRPGPLVWPGATGPREQGEPRGCDGSDYSPRYAAWIRGSLSSTSARSVAGIDPVSIT